MALQTSGPISLNDIQTEFGGSNPIAISEYYGAAAGIPASGTISIGAFYGASAGPAYLDTQTITVGSQSSQYVTWRGYDGDTLNFGSISDGTSNLYGGATILRITNVNNNATSFQVQGNRANSGWTTMTIDGVDFARTAASYNYSSSSNSTTWSWSPTSNPFGTTDGVEVTVTWI